MLLNTSDLRKKHVFQLLTLDWAMFNECLMVEKKIARRERSDSTMVNYCGEKGRNELAIRGDEKKEKESGGRKDYAKLATASPRHPLHWASVSVPPPPPRRRERTRAWRGREGDE